MKEHWEDNPTFASQQHLYEGDRQFATTLARGLDVLRCFTPLHPILGNKEISERSGLPKPTVSRLTYTLMRLGYLQQDPRSGRYRLGSAVLSISYPLLANLDIRQVARPFMRELAEYSQGWVSIGVRERLNMIYVETTRYATVPRSRPEVGKSFPIIQASMGRAYLCSLPDVQRNSLLNEIKVKSPDLWEKYSRLLPSWAEDYATHGFCIRHGDVDPNAHSVGAGLRLPDGEVFGFNCAVPIYALKPRQLQQDLGPRLVDMVHNIEASLGLH